MAEDLGITKTRIQIKRFLIIYNRNEEPHVKKRMGKHGEKVDLILRVDLVMLEFLNKFVFTNPKIISGSARHLR